MWPEACPKKPVTATGPVDPVRDFLLRRQPGSHDTPRHRLVVLDAVGGATRWANFEHELVSGSAHGVDEIIEGIHLVSPNARFCRASARDVDLDWCPVAHVRSVTLPEKCPAERYLSGADDVDEPAVSAADATICA